MYFFLTGCVSLPTYIKSCSKTSRATTTDTRVHSNITYVSEKSVQYITYCIVLSFRIQKIREKSCSGQ